MVGGSTGRISDYRLKHCSAHGTRNEVGTFLFSRDTATSGREEESSGWLFQEYGLSKVDRGTVAMTSNTALKSDDPPGWLDSPQLGL